MPRRNRGRARHISLPPALPEDVWNVQLPDLAQSLREYMASPPVDLSGIMGRTGGSFTLDTVDTNDLNVESDGSFLTVGDRSYRIISTDHTTVTTAGETWTGSQDSITFAPLPEFNEFDPTRLRESYPHPHRTPSHFGALRVETPKLTALRHPEGRHAQSAFVENRGEKNHRMTVMVTLDLEDQPDDQLLAYLDRAFAVVIQALTTKVPVDRSRRSIIIDDEETDGNAAEQKSEARKEG